MYFGEVDNNNSYIFSYNGNLNKQENIIKDIKFEGYNSKKSLLQQLFRRYSLIIQNNLSEEQVDWRAKNVLKEGFAQDSKSAIKALLSKTLNYRSFDYLRQTLLFNYIHANTDVFKNIKYLIVDDADEITPVCFDFICKLKPQLKDIFVACDKLGSSRTGYLSADKNVYKKFCDLLNVEPLVLDSATKMAKNAQILFENIIGQGSGKITCFSSISPSKRATMIDLAVLKIEELLKSGLKPSDISIISPVMDNMLKFCLQEKIQSANLLFLSGSEKLIQNPYVLATLIILKLNTQLKDELSEFDLRVILANILDIPIRHCKYILEYFNKTKNLVDYEFDLEEYTQKYNKFRDIVSFLSSCDLQMSEQVYKIFKELFVFKQVNRNEINKFTFFVKELQDFEAVFPVDFIKNKKEEIIKQIEHSIIAENPYLTIEIDEQDLVVATPQKIIDNQII